MGTTMRLDDLDYRILAELQQNGRESFKNIARRLNVSDGTVRLRTERMVSAGYLRIKASVDPLYFENCIVAQVGINLKQRADRAIMERIAGFRGVQSVVNVTGRYDLIIEVFVDSRQELRRFLVEDLSAIEGVTNSESFVYLEAIDKWAQRTAPAPE